MPKGIRKVAEAPKDETTKIYVDLPIELAVRVKRAASQDERPVNVFLRRWIAANIDAMDPDGAEGAAE